MIIDLTELQVALRNLRIFEEVLTALRTQQTENNPDLLAGAMTSYLNRFTLLQSEAAEYLYAHPSDVSTLAAALPLELQAA